MFFRDVDVLRLFQAAELSSPTVAIWGTRVKWLPALPLSVCLALRYTRHPGSLFQAES
jgi:hypothetical protein